MVNAIVSGGLIALVFYALNLVASNQTLTIRRTALIMAWISASLVVMFLALNALLAYLVLPSIVSHPNLSAVSSGEYLLRATEELMRTRWFMLTGSIVAISGLLLMFRTSLASLGKPAVAPVKRRLFLVGLFMLLLGTWYSAMLLPGFLGPLLNPRIPAAEGIEDMGNP